MRILEQLLKTVQLRIEDIQWVWQALKDYSASNTDFSDALIARHHAQCGCETTLTFDRKAARLAGFTQLSSVQ